MSRDTSVSELSIDWTTVIRFPVGEGYFSLPSNPDWLCVPSRLLSYGHQGSLPEVKWPEKGRLHAHSSEIKNELSFILLLHMTSWGDAKA